MMARYQEETDQRGWFSRLHLSWPMLFLIGWLLYELTTKPTLGAVAVCLKFGWEDLRAAIWLRRVDPRRLRGRACFWLYLASGLAKTAGIAFLMGIAFVGVSPKGPAAQGPRLAAIIEMVAWTGLTTLAGFGCAVMALGYAAGLAHRGGFKLWLSCDIHRARRRNDWPPYGLSIVQNNRLWILLGIIGFVVSLPIYLCMFNAIFIAMIPRLGVLPGTVFSVAGSVFLFIGGCAILLFHLKNQKWLVASHPGECWGEDEASSPNAESMAETFSNPIK